MNKCITKEGLENLKKELQYLEKERRREVAEKLKFAASFGDLSENSAYDDAKSEQNMLETQIARLRETIKTATIVDSEKKANFIQIGSKVKIREGRKERDIWIVDGQSADPSQGKISCDSPMGSAFLNKKVEDVCVVETPVGEKKFKIISIKN